MSVDARGVLYSPYGSFELKQKYQRNLAISTTTVLLITCCAVAVSLLISEPTRTVIIDRVEPRQELEQAFEFDKEYEIDRSQPAFGGGGNSPDGNGIFIPIPDGEFLETELTLPPSDVGPIGDSIYDSGGAGPGTDGSTDGAPYLQPSVALAFQAVEVFPEPIYTENPIYPRLAKMAGITGAVWIRALVDIEGKVERAEALKSSGVIALDESAIRAALKCTYKPGIQNGRPVRVWVTYKVVFELGD